MDLWAVKRKLTRDNMIAGQRRLRRGLAIRYLDPERPARFPGTVQIEATSRCNLRCPLCSHSREAGPGQHLSRDDLDAILQRLPWVPVEVRLSGIGEPLVHPHFFELVDLLAARDIRCEFYTNGTLLGRRGVRDAILSRKNIRSVRVSCDGATKATFESMRLGADFDNWRQVVRAFLVQAKEQRGDTLTTGVGTVLSRQNIKQIDGIIRLVADLGFDEVYVVDPIAIDDTAAAWCPTQMELAELQKRTGDLRDLGKTLGVLVGFHFRRDEQSRPPFSIRCIQPWEYIFVRADGNVAPCCAVFGSDKGAVMGNVIREDFAAIWRGEPYRSFRRSSASGTNELCRSCSLY